MSRSSIHEIVARYRAEGDTAFEPRSRRPLTSRPTSINADRHWVVFMRHIGLGRTLDGTPVILLIAGYDIGVIHHTTGEVIRTLTIDPQRRYHGTGRPPGGPDGPRKTKRSGP